MGADGTTATRSPRRLYGMKPAEDRSRALQAGYQTHLAKPVEANELLMPIASFSASMDRRQRNV